MRKLGYIRGFHGSEGAAKFFWLLSTRYFDVFLNYSPPNNFWLGAAPDIFEKWGHAPSNSHRDSLNPSLGRRGGAQGVDIGGRKAMTKG